MSSPEDILIAHYQAVRAEEMERIRNRDQYVFHFAVAVAAISGVYVADQSWWGLLALVPFLALVTAFMYAHTDVTLGALSRWLRFDYTSMLHQHFKLPDGTPLPLHHWDGAGSQAEYVRSVVFVVRYLCISLLLGGTSCVATAVATPLLKSQFPNKATVVLVVLYTFSALSLMAPILGWAKRIQQVRP